MVSKKIKDWRWKERQNQNISKISRMETEKETKFSTLSTSCQDP